MDRASRPHDNPDDERLTTLAPALGLSVPCNATVAME